MKLTLQSEDPVSFEHFQCKLEMTAWLSISHIFCLKTVHILSITRVHVLIFQHGIHVNFCIICQSQHLNQTSVGEIKLSNLPWAGHHKEESLIDVLTLKCEVVPSSTTLEKLRKVRVLEQAAKATLLPTLEMKILLDHLNTFLDNRCWKQAKKYLSTTSISDS